MEYYKEVKTVGLTAGQTLNLSSATYNHKAFAVAEDGGIFTAYFYSKGNIDPTGLTFNDPVTAFSLKTIVPIRLAKIVPEGNGTLYLFN
jgi:hypothetical protein